MLGSRSKKKEPSEDDVKAFLGNGTAFSGKLVFTGSVRVDGNFTGDIMGGGVLISGEGSRIEGTITVNSIVISGDVFGNLEAKEKVEIDSRGRLFGDMVSSLLVMQEGAVFEGNCRMASRGLTAGQVKEIPNRDED